MTSEQTILQALAQAKDEEATRIFHQCLRDLVRVGLLKTMAAEVEMLCGPKYHPEPDCEFRRAGSEAGHAFVNGGKESIRRPRVRSVEGEEVTLESYRLASDRASLFDAVVEAVAAGMPVRGVENCHGGAVKRTQASEMWVEKSRAELERLRSRSLVAEDWLALWIDGVHIGNDQCVIAAIGLHADGTKEVLDFEPGASENAEVCRLLLERITERGFAPPPGQRLLIIRDDSKALKKAVSRFWPEAVQQECLVHAERVVLTKLPRKAREEAVRRFNVLRNSQGKSAGEEAFEELLAHLQAHNDAAAAALSARREGLLAFHQLDVSAELNALFLSTNTIENVFRNWRSATRHIKRWQKGSEMISRWTATGLLKAEAGFRKVRAYERLPGLAAALRIAPDSASTPDEVAPAPSSCAPAKSGQTTILP